MKRHYKIVLACGSAFVVVVILVFIFLMYYYQDPFVPCHSIFESKVSLLFIEKVPILENKLEANILAWSEWKSLRSSKEFIRVCILSNMPFDKVFVNKNETYFFKHSHDSGKFFYTLYINSNIGDYEISAKLK